MAKPRPQKAAAPSGKKRKGSRLERLFRRCAGLLLGGSLAFGAVANYLEQRNKAAETPDAPAAEQQAQTVPPARSMAFDAKANAYAYSLPGISKYCLTTGKKADAQTCLETATGIFVVFPSWHAAAASMYGDIDQIGKGIFQTPELVLRAAQMESNMGRDAVSLTVLKDGRKLVGSYKGPLQFAAQDDSYLDDWAQKKKIMMRIKDRIPVLAGYADLTEDIMRQEQIIKDPQASAAMFLSDMLIRHIRLERRFEVMDKYGRNVHMGLSYLGHLHQWAQSKAITGFGCNMTWADFAKGLPDKTRETYRTHFRSNHVMFGAHGQNRPADTILAFMSKTQKAAAHLTGATGIPIIKTDIAQSRKAAACAAPRSNAQIAAAKPQATTATAARPQAKPTTFVLPRKNPRAG